MLDDLLPLAHFPESQLRIGHAFRTKNLSTHRITCTKSNWIKKALRLALMSSSKLRKVCENQPDSTFAFTRWSLRLKLS